MADGARRRRGVPRHTLPLTREEIAFLYQYQTGELTACLEAEGFSVERPPYESKFIEDYLADGPEWGHYDNIDADGEDWVALNERCPQIPAGFRGS